MYNWLLIRKKDGEYIGWSRSEKKPHCGEPELLEWIEWGKELPEDIENDELSRDKKTGGSLYRFKKGKTKKTNKLVKEKTDAR